VSGDCRCSSRIHHLIDKDVTIPAGKSVDILRQYEVGLFEFALVDSPSPLIELMMQLDDQPEPLAFVSLQTLRDMGLDEPLAYHWYVSKFDLAPANRYVGVWSNDAQEAYFTKMWFSVRNPTAAPITLRRVELRRVVQCQEGY